MTQPVNPVDIQAIRQRIASSVPPAYQHACSNHLEVYRNAFLGPPGEPDAAGRKWEYTTIDDTDLSVFTSRLNEMGQDGWELCAVKDDSYGQTYIFKRQVR